MTRSRNPMPFKRHFNPRQVLQCALQPLELRVMLSQTLLNTDGNCTNQTSAVVASPDVSAATMPGLTVTSHAITPFILPANSPPEITILHNGVSIPNNDPTRYDLGTVFQFDPKPTFEITIKNDGDINSDLELSNVSITALSGFTIIQSPVTSLGSGGTTTLKVELDTSTVGAKTATIQINSNDEDGGDGVESPFLIKLKGTVNPLLPQLSVLTGNNVLLPNNAISDLGTIPKNDFATITYTIHNSGNANLTLSSFIIPPGFLSLHTPASPITPGNSDTLLIKLDSSTAGPKSGQLSFHTNDDNANTFAITLTGTVTAPQIRVEHNSAIDNNDFKNPVNLGSVVHNAPAPIVPLTIHNLGTAELDLSNFTISPGFVLGNHDANIAPGTSGTIDVKLDSLTPPEFKSGQLQFNTNDDSANPFVIYLGGIVTSPQINVFTANNIPLLNNNAPPVDLGSVLQKASVFATFTIENGGNADLVLSNFTSSQDFFIRQPLPTSIAPGASGAIQIEFDGASSPGPKSGQLQFNTNDDAANPFVINLKSSVTALQSQIKVFTTSNTPLPNNNATRTDLGTVPLNGLANVTFTIKNVGNINLTLSNFIIPSGFQSVHTPASLIAPGGFDTLQIKLDSSTSGDKLGQIQFNTDDTSANPFVIKLQGTVTLPLVVTPPAPGELFIKQVYRDVLHREVDPAGLTYWLSYYSGGHNYADIAIAITSSREYDGIVVDAFYVQYLGRHSDSSGLNIWVDQMQAGLNAEVIRAGILGSDEYYNLQGGTDTAYITVLYHNFLNRDPDGAGLNIWIGQLDHSSPAAATYARIVVSTSISNSTESRTAIVTAFYQSYLHRAPDPAGLQIWITNLANGISQPQIISFFVTAQEYLDLNHIT